MVYAIIGMIVGMMSAFAAYLTLDITLLGVLAVYAGVGLGSACLMIALVVLRPEAAPLDHHATAPETGWTKETV